MTVAGYLRRRKRDLDLLAADPGAEKLCRAVLLSGGGMLLAAIPGKAAACPWGQPWAATTKGGWCLLAALGAAGGYRLFWQSRWLPGLWFTALALALHLAALLARHGGLLLRGGCFGALCAATALPFRQAPGFALLWGSTGCLGVWIPGWAMDTGHPTAVCLTFSLGLRALAAAGLKGWPVSQQASPRRQGPSPPPLWLGPLWSGPGFRGLPRNVRGLDAPGPAP